MTKKLINGIILAGILTILLGTSVFAAIDIDGGTWDYGYKNIYTTIYSKYYHPGTVHGSSVDGAWFAYDYNKGRGEWSNAEADAALSGNHCYYNIGYRDVRSRSNNYIYDGVVTLPDVSTFK